MRAQIYVMTSLKDISNNISCFSLKKKEGKFCTKL